MDVVTLYEALVYLHECNKKGLFVKDNEEEKIYKPGSVSAKKVSVKDLWSRRVLLQWGIKNKKGRNEVLKPTESTIKWKF